MNINVENTTSAPKTVVIFGREHSIPLKPSTVNEAYQVLNISRGGKTRFTYSQQNSVGAFYKREDGSEIQMGPYPAEPGTTWAIVFTSQNDSGSMAQDGKPTVQLFSIIIYQVIFHIVIIIIVKHPSAYSGYLIYNKPPSNTPWGGRMVNVGLYNGEKLLLAKNNIRVGDYVELKPTNNLYLCCMEVPSPSSAAFDVNEIFSDKRTSISEDDTDFFDVEFSRLTKIELNNFQNGLDIVLKENDITGMLSFVPKPKF